jgi:MFS transporter, Spinster family, sphingosine-1-phosphate transporter
MTKAGLLNTPEFYFILLSGINLFNYVDRGIIPGASEEFSDFITDNIDTSHPSLYIGLLQSAFIVGFCIASPIFATLVHHHGPFHLVSIGIAIWIVAVFISGFAYSANSYSMLVIGRILSGVGEASFQCCIPPWIATNADEKTKSTWLAIFSTAIPVGTAVGYVYSSLVSTSLNWGYAFFIEGAIIFPFLVFIVSVKGRFPHVKAGVRHFEFVNEMDNEEIVPVTNSTNEPERHISISQLIGDEGEEDMYSGMNTPLTLKESTPNSSKDEYCLDSSVDAAPPSVWEEVKEVCQFPCYVYIVAGYTAQTGALIGLSTFGSAFIMGLDYFDSEVQSSTCFGAVVSVAGIVGFPLGGFILDYFSTKSKALRGHTHLELIRATVLMIWTSIFGSILFSSVYFVRSRVLFLILLFFGCLAIFVCSSAIVIAIMLSVPVENRAIAIAFCSIVIHMLGDVPSPIIVGKSHAR